MRCIRGLIWLPLLAMGGLIGYAIGASIGGDTAALIGAVLGILASQMIQEALWGDRRPARVPPPWWNR